ncbi:PLDc N-terminal domain-containing protein [Candidatus Contubernalis alkaliaceticus]|uniref:PLDc N-terminal domain-containing protein n=1 Tax=Candidatus Contubernalis alkaliaceticus TaxID=338645 RepID=UPI001F4C1D23|nr:PLDc N-terminal domain-containing protein [Candidatus Contubernalis alkalaceticus]UNC92194.1 PLDc_N domain-containing protein [Candidatus Contubernalis alkalaceticus]
MMTDLLTVEYLLILAPLLLFEFVLKGICIVKIFREGVTSLSKWVWLAIVLFISTLGPISFLIWGRRRDI